jgi:hypothetical protein
MVQSFALMGAAGYVAPRHMQAYRLRTANAIIHVRHCRSD